jgi:uncharacterized protein (UPF0332 family)
LNQEAEKYFAIAQEALDAAVILYDNKLYRRSLSSCYYTMFYVASALLVNIGLRYSSHSAVISYFGLYFIKTGKIPSYFGKILNKMFDERDVADYRIFEPVLPEIVAARIEDARNFIGVAKNFLAGEENKQIP